MRFNKWTLVVAIAFVFSALLAPVSRAQDYYVEFVIPTNSAPIKSFELYGESSSNKVYQAWCAGTTNRIAYKSWNLPQLPCKLSVRSVPLDPLNTNMVFSETIVFDPADFVVKTNTPTPLPNPVLPVSFPRIYKL